MAQRIHTNEICQHIISLIDTNLSTTLGLNLICEGGLEWYAGIENISQDLPAIFVKPHPSCTMESRASSQRYIVSYTFRIVYLQQWNAGDEVIRNKIDNASKIAELLIDNFKLPTLSLTNGQIINSNVAEMEFEPEEDIFVATIKEEITAIAIKFLVDVATQV